MKKAILTLALIGFAFASQAQFVLGGQVAFGHAGANTNDNGTTATTTFTIQPKVGYQITDRIQAGLAFGMGYDYNRTYFGTGYDNYTSTTQTSWLIAPYARYNVAQWRKCTLFAELQLSVGIRPDGSAYSTVTDQSTDINAHSTLLQCTLMPGLNYALSDHCSLDMYINLLGIYYNYQSTTTGTGSLETNTHTHNYGLTANMTAQTLTNHFNNFSIGFNYHF